MNLKDLYEESKGIVHKCRKDYHLHLWEKEDWDQEGMLCLYELVSRNPELLEGSAIDFMSALKQSLEIVS